MNSPSPARQAAQQVTDPDRELAQAEARGADEVRADVRRLIDDRRRIVRLGDQQIEVVEVSALVELLEESE